VDAELPRTWGEWAEKLEEHDRLGSGPLQTEQERVNAARRADWERYLQESVKAQPRETQTKVLGRDPSWGRVVSRDHRAVPPQTRFLRELADTPVGTSFSLDEVARRHGIKPPVLDTVGVEAASPERAPEAAALFAGLLAEPSTNEFTVCACGLIGGGCFPVKARLDKRAKFLRVKGTDQYLLSRDDLKSLQDHRRAAGKPVPPVDDGYLHPDRLEESDHYE
jgi:hypothetical protein